MTMMILRLKFLVKNEFFSLRDTLDRLQVNTFCHAPAATLKLSRHSFMIQQGMHQDILFPFSIHSLEVLLSRSKALTKFVTLRLLRSLMVTKLAIKSFTHSTL